MGLVLALGRKGALGDILIAAPVVEVGNPHAANQYAQAGKIEVGIPYPSFSVRHHHLAFFEDHVEMPGRFPAQHGEALQGIAVANEVEGKVGGGKPAEQQEHDLNDIRPCNCF